ncbi:MAG TPA: Na(+)/H(+) antiporter subunit B [Bacillus sp. (in: firmicutes)]|nr:Na(+)/H(+) antiporter subunit B [Bacillus sp. (in: firmicutes)]
MKVNDLVLQTITKVIVFMILIFSIYLFWTGHYTPGGGFVGGLMASSGLVLLLVAFDVETVKNVIPFDYKMLIAAGLLVAVLTGLGSFLFDVPFLTHTFGHLHLPALGEVSLATASLFDLGVYLVVVGVTMTIIQTIGESE